MGIISGGIWGVTVKVKEFSNFIKKNGWQPIKKNVHDFFMTILRVIVYIIIGIGYLSGFIFIPIYFEVLLQNENRTTSFILIYLFLGLVAFYYISGTRRKETKNIIVMLESDFDDFKNGIKEFVQGVGTLTKALLVLVGWLLAIVAVIGVIALGIWLIVALGPLWVIAIVLILILLAIVSR